MTNNNGHWLRAWLPFILWLVTTLVGVTLAYASLDTRMSVLESQRQTLQDDVREMKADIKRLLERVR